VAQVKDPAVLQTIVSNLSGMPIQKAGEGEYTISMGGVTVLFGVKGDVLYCTTDAFQGKRPFESRTAVYHKPRRLLQIDLRYVPADQFANFVADSLKGILLLVRHIDYGSPALHRTIGFQVFEHGQHGERGLDLRVDITADKLRVSAVTPSKST